MSCQVISLAAYRQNKAAVQKRGRNKILSKLSLMRALIGVYQQEMTRVAQDPEVARVCAEKDLDATSQISNDVERLHRLEACLRQAVFEKGAKDLPEASQMIRFWAPESIIETLDQLLASTYSGFQKIAALISPNPHTASKLESY